MAWRDEVEVQIQFSDLMEKTLPREWCVQDMLHKMAWDALKVKYPNIDYVNEFNTNIERVETWNGGCLIVVFSIEPLENEENNG